MELRRRPMTWIGNKFDQLHAATLQVSGNCFELKKLCATVLIAAGTLVATLTDREVDAALFVAALTVVLLFWTADAQSYFIQAKLRTRMKELQQTRILRAHELGGYDADGVGMPIEAQPGRAHRVFHSFFNASMLYYFLIGAVLVATWLAYEAGLIS